MGKRKRKRREEEEGWKGRNTEENERTRKRDRNRKRTVTKETGEERWKGRKTEEKERREKREERREKSRRAPHSHGRAARARAAAGARPASLPAWRRTAWTWPPRAAAGAGPSGAALCPRFQRGPAPKISSLPCVPVSSSVARREEEPSEIFVYSTVVYWRLRCYSIYILIYSSVFHSARRRVL